MQYLSEESHTHTQLRSGLSISCFVFKMPNKWSERLFFYYQIYVCVYGGLGNTWSTILTSCFCPLKTALKQKLDPLTDVKLLSLCTASKVTCKCVWACAWIDSHNDVEVIKEKRTWSCLLRCFALLWKKENVIHVMKSKPCRKKYNSNKISLSSTSETASQRQKLLTASYMSFQR